MATWGADASRFCDRQRSFGLNDWADFTGNIDNWGDAPRGNMASRQWFIGRGGKQEGPYPDERLRELIAGGSVAADNPGVDPRHERLGQGLGGAGLDVRRAAAAGADAGVDSSGRLRHRCHRAAIDPCPGLAAIRPGHRRFDRAAHHHPRALGGAVVLSMVCRSDRLSRAAAGDVRGQARGHLVHLHLERAARLCRIHL